jgi:hypothetical protein
MKIFLIALCVCLSVAAQSESFEKRAISAAQRIPASNLDAKLPNRSFGAWLSGLVGKDAGVVWQLAECGAGAPGGTSQDSLACAEATVLLPNGDTVIVGISIGTFKLGLIGEPTFQGAFIKTDERILQVRRLSDLPGMLPPPNGVSRQPLLRADLGRESRGVARSLGVAPSRIRPRRRSTLAMNSPRRNFRRRMRGRRRRRLWRGHSKARGNWWTPALLRGAGRSIPPPPSPWALQGKSR